jgi:DNA-binding NarL/FixJ family response regulator
LHIGPLLDRAIESVRAALGSSAYQTEFRTGTRLSREAAIGLALGEPTTAAPGGADASPLGGRETEVAGLIAEGVSNKQIGARLLISEHTVNSHIRHIMNKLGCGSRAQIAARMAGLEPGAR